MDKITIDEVQALRDDGKDLTIIDSRSADAWNSSDEKARDAIRVPPDDVETHLQEIDEGRPIIVYCT